MSVLVSLYITKGYISRHNVGDHNGQTDRRFQMKEKRELSLESQSKDDEQRIKYHTMVADQLFAENIWKNLEYVYLDIVQECFAPEKQYV